MCDFSFPRGTDRDHVSKYLFGAIWPLECKDDSSYISDKKISKVSGLSVQEVGDLSHKSSHI